MGGRERKKFPLFKRGGGRERFYPVLKRGGAQKVSVLQFSHFVAPTLPVSNDQSLKCFRYCSIFNKPAYKCVFLVMLRPPLPPCTHLYALLLTPPPPLDAYVINGRPLMLFDLTFEFFIRPRQPSITRQYIPNMST